MDSRRWAAIVGLVLLASLAVGCTEPDLVEVTRVVEQEAIKEVEVTRVVQEEVVKEVEVTRIVEVEVVKEVTRSAPASSEGTGSLASLAKSIRDGDTDVGDEYGMGVGERFHEIHEVVDVECSQCHVSDLSYELAQPNEDAPDPVDRRGCLGCHLNGPATILYAAKE